MSRVTKLIAIGATVPLVATGLVAIPLAQPALADEVVYTTPGTDTWTVPTGTEKIYIEVTGGGGRGGNSSAGMSAQASTAAHLPPAVWLTIAQALKFRVLADAPAGG